MRINLKMKIFVKNLSLEKTYTIDVNLEDTIEKIKSILFVQFGIPEELKIYLNTYKCLDNDKSLYDYNI